MNWISEIGACVPFAALSAIGLLLDKLVRSREKAQFHDWLISWWMKFDDLRWSRFGKEEARAAVECFDSLVGASLWSARRWQATGLLLAAAMLGLSLKLIFLVPGFASSLLSTGETSWWLSGGKWWAATQVAFLLIVIPLSLSFTRAISVLFVRFFGDAGIWAWLALLLLHVALYWWWAPIVTGLINGVGFLLVIFVAAFTREVDEIRLHMPKDSMEFMQIMRCSSWQCALLRVTYFAQDALFNFINGARIAFAGLFLVSYAGGPIVKDIVSRVCEAVLESKRPIIAVLFIVIGAIVSVLCWIQGRLA